MKSNRLSYAENMAVALNIKPAKSRDNNSSSEQLTAELTAESHVAFCSQNSSSMNHWYHAPSFFLFKQIRQPQPDMSEITCIESNNLSNMRFHLLY